MQVNKKCFRLKNVKKSLNNVISIFYCNYLGKNVLFS